MVLRGFIFYFDALEIYATKKQTGLVGIAALYCICCSSFGRAVFKIKA